VHFVSALSRALKELARPDNQGNDWYAWASNQMSHALLGVIVALYYPSVVLAVIIGSLKECVDLLKAPKKATLFDSVQDVAFWAMGAWLIIASDKNVAVIFLLFGLVCGVIPRIRKVK
jgi:hypothetical protein